MHRAAIPTHHVCGHEEGVDDRLLRGFTRCLQQGIDVCLVDALLGVGIAPPEISARDPIGGTESQGYGLGLAIVKRLCKRYNWLLKVSSKPEEGTKVSVFFPEIQS